MFTNRRAPWTGPLRDAALAHPGVTEGIACEATAAEKRTLEVNGKAFLFLGLADALFKLDASLADARAVAATSPATCRVGKTGWVKLDAPISTRRMTAWIGESYALAATARDAQTKTPAAKGTPPTAKGTPPTAKATAPRANRKARAEKAKAPGAKTKAQ